MHLSQSPSFESLQALWGSFTEHPGMDSIRALILGIILYVIGIENAELLLILTIAISLDTVIGMIHAVKTRTFSAHGMGKLLWKTILYTIFIGIAHVTETGLVISIGGELFHVIDVSAYLYLILREGQSVSEKLAIYGVNFPIPFSKIQERINIEIERRFLK